MKTIKSIRGTDIPVTIKEANGKAGLIILAHGFKSERSEDNRFLFVQEALKDNFYSIAMDFPGCNESKESFLNYSLTNCLDDMESCLQYMLENYPIDTNKMVLVGYSMGGRLISIFSNKHPEFNTLVFWAGACYKGYQDNKFIGQDVNELKRQLKNNDYCNFYDMFEKTYMKLSKQFVYDMEEYDTEYCLNNFEGNALIIQGNKDITINPNNGEYIYNNLLKAKNRRLEIIDGADHGFGLWDGRVQDSERLVDLTVTFIKNFKDI